MALRIENFSIDIFLWREIAGRDEDAEQEVEGKPDKTDHQHKCRIRREAADKQGKYHQ